MGRTLGTIALITLVRSADDKTPTAELIEEIQAAIRSTKISKDWSIEKISVLGEDGVLASGESTVPNKMAPSYGD